MELIETPIFSKQVLATCSDEEYRAFQLHLILPPDAGAIIPGSGGSGRFDGKCPVAENGLALA